MNDRNLQIEDCAAPVVHRGQVLREWIDVNDHMNVAYYLLAFDYGIDGLWQTFGITDERRDATGSSTFAVESHIRYLNELVLDEPFVVKSQIIAFDDKRLHQYQYLFSERSGLLSATCEWLHLHVNLTTRRVSPWPDDLLHNIANHPCTMTDLPTPAALGQTIKIAHPLTTSEYQ
ncbi:MAG: thioesterase family protein [Pseudomonadota bacterium]